MWASLSGEGGCGNSCCETPTHTACHTDAPETATGGFCLSGVHLSFRQQRSDFPLGTTPVALQTLGGGRTFEPKWLVPALAQGRQATHARGIRGGE